MQTIRLEGVVGWDITAEYVSRKLENQSHVKIILNSGGGDIFEGFSVYNALKAFDGKLEFDIDYAASIASIFPFAGESEMSANSSIFMIHEAWGASAGTSTEHRKHADDLEKMQGLITNIYEEKSNLSRDEIVAMMKSETYFDASEALEAGFIDRIKDSSKSADIASMALKAVGNVSFDAGKLLAKIKDGKKRNCSLKNSLQSCKTLSDIEKELRNIAKVSRADATAIVSKVKEVAQGEPDANQVVNTLKNLKLSI